MSFKMAVHASLHVLANIKYISFVIFKYDASKKKSFSFLPLFTSRNAMTHFSTGALNSTAMTSIDFFGNHDNVELTLASIWNSIKGDQYVPVSLNYKILQSITIHVILCITKRHCTWDSYRYLVLEASFPFSITKLKLMRMLLL